MATTSLLDRPAGPAAPGPYQPRHALEQRRVERATNITLWVIVLLTSGVVAGTTALFDASTTDTGNRFGVASLTQPTLQAGNKMLALRGSHLQMTVTQEGTIEGGGSVGTRWRYAHPATGISSNGAPPTTACGTTPGGYPAAQDLGESTSNTLTAGYTGLANHQGRWTCVLGLTTYPTPRPASGQWVSQIGNPAEVVQLGHVIQRVELRNGSALDGRMQAGDQIVVTFNQPVDDAQKPTGVKVCTRNNRDAIWVGPSDNICDDTEAGVRLFFLLPKNSFSHNATTEFSVNNSGSGEWNATNDVLTLTLIGGTTVTFSGCSETVACFTAQTGGIFRGTNFAITPATLLRSAAYAGTTQVNLCVAQPTGAPNNGICHPDTVGNF